MNKVGGILETSSLGKYLISNSYENRYTNVTHAVHAVLSVPSYQTK